MATSNAPTGEIGSIAQVGTSPATITRGASWSGFIADAEHVPELRWPESVRWYERMLYTDSQAEALYLGLTLPLLQYEWALDPNGADPAATERLAADLGLPVGLAPEGEDPPPILPGLHKFNFTEHLSETLLAIPLGHYPFELVGFADPADDQWWHLQKLAPRAPSTLMEIHVKPDGGLVGIRQNIPGQQQVTNGTPLGLPGPPLIPAERLVFYVWRGDARSKWVGRPMLRSMYRHWLVKDTLIRVDAINHERAGGIPGVETDERWQGGDLTQLQALASQARIGEDSGFALPPGAHMVLARAAGSPPDVVASIQYHDEAMARTWQSMVMQLGQTQTGSRALGQTFEGLQDQARIAIAEWFRGTFREHVIEKWWEFNLGEAFPPPKHPLLVYRPRQGSHGQQPPTALPQPQTPPVEQAPPVQPVAQLAAGARPDTERLRAAGFSGEEIAGIQRGWESAKRSRYEGCSPPA